MANPELENYMAQIPGPWSGPDLLHFLAGKLRIRMEPGRKRLDMEKVIHLELLMPDERGSSKWTPISTTPLEDK